MTNDGQPTILGRMVAAALVDISVVTIPTALAVMVLHERFPFLPGSAGLRFSPSDQERIDQIDNGFSRALELGDSLYTLSGRGWWFSLGLLVILTISVYVIVPAKYRLRTPGQLLMGIAPPVTDEPEIVAVIDLSAPPPDPSEPAEQQAGPEDGEDDEAGGDNPDRGDANNNTSDTSDTAEGVAAPDRADPDAEDECDRSHPDADGDRTADDVPEAATTGTEAEAGPADNPDRTESVEADQVDLTDRAHLGAITLADEADYLRWDRDNGQSSEPQGTSGAARDSSFEKLALPESSLSDAPLTVATLVKVTTDEGHTTVDQPDIERVPDAGSPVWNEGWKAWLYWDAGRQLWFRHDTETGGWKPLV